MTRPGQSFRRVAARFFSAAAMSRVVEPVIADWQAEYADAVARQFLWRSRWIRYSGYAVLAKTLAVYGGWRLRAQMRAWSAEDSGALGRMIGISTAVTTALVVLFAYDPMRKGLANHLSVALMVYLLPQAIPIAAPIGLSLGILYGSRGLGLSRRFVAAGVVAALAVCFGSFALMDEIIPSANQAFRVAAFHAVNPTDGSELSRGRAELTFAELRQRVEKARQIGLTDHEARMLAFDIYQRQALAFAALPLAVLALVVGTRRRYGAVTSAAVGVGATALYYIVMGTTSRLVALGAIPWLVVWLPHVGVFVLSALLAWRSGPSSTLRPNRAL